MSTIRIAQAQINPTVGDIPGNAAKIIAGLKQAEVRGADVVTFPELSLCGYPPEDLLLRRSFLEDCAEYLNKITPEVGNLTAVIGFPFKDGYKIYNSAAVIGRGKMIGIYNKIELPNYGVFDEKRYFEPGKGCFLFEISGVRFNVTICEDIWIQGSPTRDCALQNGADVTLNISASPYYAGKRMVREGIVADYAAATNCTVCFNNLVGGQDELVFDGGGMVVDRFGNVPAFSRQFEEDMLLFDLPADIPRLQSPCWNLIMPVTESAPNPLREKPEISPNDEPHPGRVEEVYKALVLGTRDYVLKNGFKQVVIGLSGGIDSALTAAIAVDALGTEQVRGVTMPSEFTSNETRTDAELLANNLQIGMFTIPIKGILEAYRLELKDAFGPGPSGIENENLQARIRGNILMALSNRFGWLVLTTGNKSETAVGYCTLYGDMAGGFAVIKDVPKTWVYELSDYVNQKHGKEIIPQRIIDRPPTAELRPDQKDEDCLPPYGILDPILKAYVEEDLSPDEINGFDPVTVLEVAGMVDRNEYKRRQAPPGIKITPKAFGKDRRLPITNKYLKARTEVRKKCEWS
jgi:NAD+ synthase (glutamine-hydrolysing)